MGLLGKLFGTKASLEGMQRALEQGSYADALHQGEDLLAAGGETADITPLMDAAADGLARLNLEEGERFIQAGDMERAQEHLQLALTQARSVELVAQVQQMLAGDTNITLDTNERLEQQETASGSSCGSCAPTPQAAEISDEDMPDLQTQLELILAAYPAELRQGYLAHSDTFKQAFLMVHTGEDELALPFWDKVPVSEQDELYYFELGSLYARLGKTDKGLAFLWQSLERGAGNLLVIDGLIELLLEKGQVGKAQELLVQQLSDGANQGFCYARLCELQYREKNTSAAFDSARKALGAGYAEAGFLVLAAGLYEDAGQTQEAEQLLSGLPGGGCGGGINLHLAEFWLRQKQELARVLDAFNGACRQEPDNPRWQLRVAQTYLARNWRKQGLDLLNRVVGDPRLDESLKYEAEKLLGEV